MAFRFSAGGRGGYARTLVLRISLFSVNSCQKNVKKTSKMIVLRSTWCGYGRRHGYFAVEDHRDIAEKYC